jgi:ParB family transcriptional regulator, chromosome partitioning protein
MASSVPKLALSRSRDIPFDQLVLSQSNVRRLKCGVSIGELADDIMRRTLLQSLNVRAVLDDDGNDTGKFEVPAGGRRFRALELLVKSKRMAKNQPVPCVVREGGSAEEDSLVENTMRMPLHPLDQFRAFKALRDAGTSEEEIAARFFAPASIIKQRLRLASVSDALLDIYGEDGMTLGQLMAFTVSSDHARQEHVWTNSGYGQHIQPHAIRRMLTEDSVDVRDRRAIFVGIAAYEAAGGYIMRDLFNRDDGGWMQYPALLDQLVNDKLRGTASDTASEGWKWVEAAIDLPYGHEHGARRITGASEPLTQADEAERDTLMEEFDALTEQYDGGDDLPEEVDARLGELETAIDAFINRPTHYDPAEMARAGVFITLDGNGKLRIDRGYVRPEDEPANDIVAQDGDEATGDASTSQTATITIGGQPVMPEPVEEEDDVIRPLPDRLVSELTAERTLALRNALAQAPDTAFIALLHALCQSTFSSHSTSGCVEIIAKHAYFGNAAPGLRDHHCAKAIDERHDAWAALLPRDALELWDVLARLELAEQMQLLAHCTSITVNALYEPTNRYNQGQVSAHTVNKRIEFADHLARTIGHDMVADGWKPTVANYLGRVTKPRILEAVREARGEEMVGLIDHLKKGDMAKEAERLLDGTGWLPEPLRLAQLDDMAEQPSDAAPGEDLPAFLNDDDDGLGDDAPEDEELEPEQFAIAAE